MRGESEMVTLLVGLLAIGAWWGVGVVIEVGFQKGRGRKSIDWAEATLLGLGFSMMLTAIIIWSYLVGGAILGGSPR